MKIVIVLETLQSGGAERVATLWANAFIKLGHEVVLATNKKQSDAPFVYNINSHVTIVKCFSMFSDVRQTWVIFLKRYLSIVYKVIKRLSNTCSALFLLRRLFRKEKPDIILGVMNTTSVYALIAALGLPCRVIATEHNAFERPAEVPLSIMQRFFKFKVNKCFKVVSVLTEADKLYIGDKLNNVYVMPNPLSLQPIKNCNEVQKEKRIVASGRLDAWHCKGFDLLIVAWARIAAKYPDWILDISGESHKNDGEAEVYLNNLIVKYGLEGRCVLSGFHKDMAQYFRRSEIFVLSSRYEGFGLVLLEAMSQGCACIAADYKGRQSEIIRNRKEGLCIPPADIDALADAIELMIKNVAYRREVQHNAIQRSKDYIPETIARKWENLIQIAMNK